MNCKKISRDEKVTIRCSEKEKEYIVKSAKKKNMSVSQYARETAMVGRESFKSKEQRQLCIRTQLMENIRQMQKSMDENELSEELKEKIDKVILEANKLWDY